PSVVYGDLTSGAVVVKTKAGVTPWEVRVKADPNLKQISAGKGFALGGENGRRGKMNFDADYAKAMSDVRTSSSAYRRANFQVGYSNTFNKKLLFNARLSGNWSDATNASDPDLFLDEIARESERGLRFNVNGRWLANLKWLTNVEYLLSGSVVSQYSRQRTYQGSAGYTATTTEMYDTENKGFFTQPQYYSDVEVFGLPIDMQARFTAHHSGQFGKVHNKALIGGEWKLGGNSGRGKVFDPYCPPSPGSGQAYRERSYRDVPYLHRFTGYAEDNFSLPIGPTKLEVQAGVRGNMLAATDLNTASLRSLEPRFNGKFTAISNREHIQSLSFRAGWGLACKMPSMVYLYPEPSYKDMVSFSYNDFDATGYGLNVLTTKRIETINNYLSLQCSENFETGVEFETDFIDGSVVYYNENMTGGYAFATTYVPMSYTRYGYSWQGDGLSQMLLPSGCNPQYWPGEGVTVASEPIPSVVDTTFMSYTTPVNAISNHKRGVEFTLDFKQFKPLSTSVSVSGAYMRMESSQNWLSHRLYPGSVGGRT
ncbi:MAG: TonB-dependent receptor, partial [Bacteroidales bacterium]|nr:TonB-dependent receptor [Bacteroidales bacterium]